MTARGELYDLLHRGAWVTVRNPWAHSEWSGRLIAIHDDPGLVIEQADGVRMCLPQEFTVTEEPAPPGRTVPGAAALRQLAADLEAEASAISGQDEPPWAAMYGLKVTSGTEAAVILRRAAQLARQRADAPLSVPATAANPPAAVAGSQPPEPP